MHSPAGQPDRCDLLQGSYTSSSIGSSSISSFVRRSGSSLSRLSAPSSRSAEPFALLVAQLAYEGKGGPELAYRFERFGEQA